MKHVLCISLFLSLSFLSRGQNIDSLKRAVFENTHDTDRVKTFLRLSSAYMDFNRDTAMDYAREALNLARQHDFKKGEAQSLNMMGSIFSGLSAYPKAFEYHLEALKIAETINNQTLIAALYNNLSRVSTERSDFRTALEYLFKAKMLFEKQQNKGYLSDALLNIGDNYERMGKLDSALYFQEWAYRLAMEADYTDNLGTIVSNLASINFKMNRLDTARHYFKMAVSILASSEFDEDKEALAGTYYEMSKFFDKQGTVDSALAYAKRSLSISMEIADHKKVLNASKLLNQLYDKAKLVDSAYKYNKIASETREAIFSEDKVAQLESMKINERIRQQDLAIKNKKEKKERTNRLQLFGIALFLVNFFAILIIISRKRKHPRALKYLGLLGLLLLFEFIAVFLHPYIAEWTHHSPVYMLLILVIIAAVLVPLHHKLEHWVKNKLPHRSTFQQATKSPTSEIQRKSGHADFPEISPSKVEEEGRPDSK